MGRLNTLGLAKTVRQLQRVPAQMARPVADRLNRWIQEGFDKGEDPYGVAWAPLAQATLDRGRFPPPLTDTRRMRSQAILVPLSGSGLALLPQISYGRRHMAGTPDMPKRRYYPDAGIPAAWHRVIEEEQHNATMRILNGE